MYRMGDLGIMRNGRVTLKGGADGQVKLYGGNRLNLSEVERVLIIQSAAKLGMEIHKALALCVEFTPIGRRAHLNPRIELRTALQVIVSYYTLTEQSTNDKQTIPDMELEKAIFSELKMPRVPCVFEQFTKFPMQAHSGKVERLKMRRQALVLVKR